MVEAPLNNMISIQVLNECDHTATQCVRNQFNLLWCVDTFDEFLHGARAVHVQRDGNEVGGNALDDGETLRGGGGFDQLLHQVVTEGIAGMMRETKKKKAAM